MTDEFRGLLLIFCVVCIVLFFVGIYIIRSVFNIPSIIRLHKAQVRLLEEMAKSQGVEQKTVDTIISETSWETLGA